MKEKLQEYALVAEVVSALAIVVSLVFVGFQIQDGNRETRSAAQQAISDQTVTFIMDMATDEHLPRLLGEITVNQARREDLAIEDVIRINAVAVAGLRRVENTFIQVNEGILDPRSLQRTSSIIYGTQYFKDFWPSITYQFDPDFANYMDAYIAEH